MGALQAFLALLVFLSFLDSSTVLKKDGVENYLFRKTEGTMLKGLKKVNEWLAQITDLLKH